MVATMKTKLIRGLLLALLVIVAAVVVIDYRYQKHVNADFDPFGDYD